MEPFTTHKGISAPLQRSDVNTDLIAPARFLLRSRAQGFADALFADLRGASGDSETFILDVPPHDRASVLVAGENFGCGSSREHAVWALADRGFKAVLAESFADIFYNNAVQNGLLPVSLPRADIHTLWATITRQPATEIAIDLPRQEITCVGRTIGFEIDAYHKTLLLEGLSEIDVTLREIDAIRAFESTRAAALPWLAKPSKG